jgi:uncharacterized membrane protein
MLRLVSWGIGFYPLVAHFGIWTSHARLAVGYLILLLFAMLLCPPRYLRTTNQALAGLLFISVICLAAFDLEYLLIYMPPVAIPCILLWLFIRSLGQGSVPVITQFAEKLEQEEMNPEREKYTRQVTILWAGVFGFMIIEALVLALWAPMAVWSWATHIGNYILIATVFIMEVCYRRYRFKMDRRQIKQFFFALIRHRRK